MSAERWKLILSAPPINAIGERQNRCRNRIRRFHWVVQINDWIIHRRTGAVALLKTSFVPLFRPSFDRIRIDRSIKRATADRNMIYGLWYVDCTAALTVSLNIFIVHRRKISRAAWDGKYVDFDTSVMRSYPDFHFFESFFTQYYWIMLF